jgi:hypothetical protein
VLLVPAPGSDPARHEATGSLTVSLSRQEVDVMLRALDCLLAREHASSTQELAGELLGHLGELSESEHVSRRNGQ